MKRHLAWLVIVLLAASPCCRAEETLYAGKPLAFWLDELKNDDPLIREEALLVLADAGPAAREAIPRLRLLLKEQPRGVRMRAALALWRIGGETKPAVAVLTEALRDPGSNNRAEVLSRLGELGDVAASSAAIVLPFLHDADGQVRMQAMKAMQRFGEAALPSILTALEDAKPQLRRAAFDALGLLGPSAKEAMPKLTALLDHDDAETRCRALFALGRIGVAARSATKAILKCTKDRDAGVRAAALTALYGFGADARDARPAALLALKDDDRFVRCRGILLLRQIDPEHPDVLPQTLKLLEQPVGRNELLLMLNQMGPAAAPAVPVLTKLLDDEATRRQAAQTLANIGPAAKSAEAALLRQLHANDVMARQFVVNALRAVHADSERLVPAVLEAVKQDLTTRSLCLPLLADRGAKAAAAVPWLVEELRRPPSSYLTTQLAETLYKIDPERARKEAVPILQKMLQPANPWRVNAALMLRQMQPNNDEALTTLIDCLTANAVNVRQQACQSLKTLGKSARKAAPALRKALRDTDLFVRVSAAAALWKIDRDTEATVPVLLETLKPSFNNPWRSFAAVQLSEMGSAIPVAALPTLRKYRDDSDQIVRECVRQAIQRIEESAKRTTPP